MAGADRYSTSITFAENMFLETDPLVLVRGEDANLADGISATVLGLPIIYVRQAAFPSSVDTHLNQVLTGISKIFVIGGTNAISDSLLIILEGKIESIPPMISSAYIIDEDEECVVIAQIDNINNTITLEVPEACQGYYFSDGHTNLSKSSFITVSDTQDGMYDIPDGGILIHPGDDFVGLILLLFGDNNPTGASVEKLLLNDGTKITLTDANNSESQRTYTIIVRTSI
ncbi:MAG: cell wall-binding repeat-containing protein [Candidatus Contubernalis sp.]|nr:cell wall-binding repeat-containing protein [Candidatus Contubernalis sp.]